MQSFPIEDYQIGIVSALPKELTAVIAILDEEHEQLKTKDAHDHNTYVLGRIGQHKVVAACLPVGVYGTNTAASVVKDMLRTFPHLRFGLLVGIGGGIPQIQAGRDIRLGDVVISQPDQTHGGVVQYDLGKRLSDGRFKRGRALNRPPTTLLTALSTIQSRRGLEDIPIPKYLEVIDQKHPFLSKHGYHFQGHNQDHLLCARCDPTHWWWMLWLLILWAWPLWRCSSCDDTNGRVRRLPRTHNNPVLHYGTIASGNTLLKNARERDRLGRDLGALCVEMEAAGVVEEFPCLVVRGICDYADAQKNDVWQEYAALTAATFVKYLLEYVSPQTAKQERPIVGVLDKMDQHFQHQETFNQRQEIRYENDRYRDCHRVFDTSQSYDGGYENYKNLNPDAVLGTCRWVLDHPQYQSWLSSTKNDLLWISADPGCGKSVLSKSLVDIHIRNSAYGSSSTICYFFFKDNEQQNNLVAALCAIIHQLFSQQPHLIRHALPAFDESGEKLKYKANDLWRIIVSAASDSEAHSVVCILDALDECRDVDRARLIDLLCELYRTSILDTSGHNTLKWLVTSRPYNDVRDGFDKIPPTLPSIRLAGEDESDQVRLEINLVIQERVKALSRELRLPSATTEQLAQQLLAMEHRTYLWLYLAIDDIKKTFREALRPVDRVIPLVPASVEEAYERILSRIDSGQKTRVMTILTIIVGARRSLTIGEMALALDVATLPKPPTCLADLSVDAEHLGDSIRQWCGLFVLVSHEHLYLLHQTAKEFLLRLNDGLIRSQTSWKYCLSPTDVDKEIATICVRYLCLSDFDDPHELRLVRILLADEYETSSVRSFLFFALEHWASYTRPVEQYLDQITRTSMRKLYDVSDWRYRWAKVSNRNEVDSFFAYDRITSDLHVAAFHGHNLLLQDLLEASQDNFGLLCGSSSTVLHIASSQGHLAVVQTLLDRGANVNAIDAHGHTSLMIASARGYVEIVRTLLDRGADLDATDEDGWTSLMWSSTEGHVMIAQILLDKRADFDVLGKLGHNALLLSSSYGHLEIVRALLQQGAKVDAHTSAGDTSLSLASESGHLEILRTLLDNGAEIDSLDRYGQTSLMSASLFGRVDVVSMLLDRGADVNAVHTECGSALTIARKKGYPMIAQLLLEHGAYDISS